MLRAKSRLKTMGYLTGNVNSEYTKNDAIALEKYQKDIGLPITGTLDQRTLLTLFLKAK